MLPQSLLADAIVFYTESIESDFVHDSAHITIAEHMQTVNYFFAVFLIFLTFFFTNFCLFDIIVFTCERRGVAQFGSAHEWGS